MAGEENGLRRHKNKPSSKMKKHPNKSSWRDPRGQMGPCKQSDPKDPKRLKKRSDHCSKISEHSLRKRCYILREIGGEQSSEMEGPNGKNKRLGSKIEGVPNAASGDKKTL